MTTIRVNYALLTAGQDGLVATWGRIESHLLQLDQAVAATADLDAQTLVSFRSIKARWDMAAEDRQVVLRSLAQAVGDVRDRYRQVDTALAAQFQV